jgi:hypothetical protein
VVVWVFVIHPFCAKTRTTSNSIAWIIIPINRVADLTICSIA